MLQWHETRTKESQKKKKDEEKNNLGTRKDESVGIKFSSSPPSKGMIRWSGSGSGSSAISWLRTQRLGHESFGTRWLTNVRQ